MPSYDYKCRACGTRFDLFYKTYADYDAAEKQCPNCASDDLARVISSVTIQQPTRDYTKMSSGEMLSVLESGDSRQVGEMFDQVGGGDPRMGKDFHDTTQRLLKGEKKESVERDLQANQSTKPDA